MTRDEAIQLFSTGENTPEGWVDRLASAGLLRLGDEPERATLRFTKRLSWCVPIKEEQVIKALDEAGVVLVDKDASG